MKKIILPLLILSLFSCKKDEEQIVILSAGDSDVVVENNQMDNMYDDLFSVSEKAKREEQESSSNNLRTNATSCHTVDLDLTNKLITVDFGTSGCLYNNKMRKGKVLISYTGNFMDAGTKITTTLEDYEVKNLVVDPSNYLQVKGTQVVENKGLVDGKMTWSVDVSDGEVLFTDGTTSTWSTSRTRTLIDEGTSSWFDEVYSIVGTAAGNTRKGTAYSMEIDSSNPLVFDWECWFESNMPKSGKVTMFEEGAYDRSINYSYNKDENEDCDRSVQVTYGEFSLNLDL